MMNESKHIQLISTIYRAAKDRWPEVDWPESEFRRHYCRAASHKTTRDEDIFLAGATGYRIRSAQDRIDTDYSLRAKSVLAQPAKVASLSSEEVWNEIFVRVLQDEPDYEIDRESRNRMGRPAAKIVEYKGERELGGYLITIGTNYIIDQHRGQDRHAKHADAVARSIHTRAQQVHADELLGEDSARITREIKEIVEGMSDDARLYFSGVWTHSLTQKHLASFYGKHSAATVCRILKEVYESFETVLGDQTRHPATRQVTLRWLERLCAFLKSDEMSASKKLEGELFVRTLQHNPTSKHASPYSSQGGTSSR